MNELKNFINNLTLSQFEVMLDLLQIDYYSKIGEGKKVFVYYNRDDEFTYGTVVIFEKNKLVGIEYN